MCLIRFLVSKNEAMWLIITQVRSDHVMEAKLVISDSTIMFCCIMFNAMFVVVR